MNIHDYAQKAVVSAYAQIISGHAEELKVEVAYSPAADDVLARVRIGGEETVYPLRLRLFSFNEYGEDPSSEAAFDAFRSWFPNPAAMIERVYARASSGIRHGMPVMTEDPLCRASNWTMDFGSTHS